MYHAECMKERYASVTPMLCLGNGYFMPTIHENRPYSLKCPSLAMYRTGQLTLSYGYIWWLYLSRIVQRMATIIGRIVYPRSLQALFWPC